jgi:alpha-tubulin suppressor-like RCC1 family protein
MDITRASLLPFLALVLSGCPSVPPVQAPKPGPEPLTCSDMRILCDGACVDTQADVVHCGECGVGCGEGEDCVEGTCQAPCAPVKTLCGGVCVDPDSDPSHCGLCGLTCAAWQVCAGGRCGCPSQLTACDGECVDLTSRADHCGACGNGCQGFPGAVFGACSKGVCVLECDMLRADCNGELEDGCEQALVDDRENCGGCGILCGNLCGGGACLSVALPSKIFHHVCVRHADGQVSCWGYNGQGQLGDGTTSDALSPRRLILPEPGEIAEVVTAEHHSCARTTDGRAWCWGRNDRGQLGTGDTVPSSTPVWVVDGGQPLLGVVGIALTDTSSCALLSMGQVKCWGSGQHGRLGNGGTADSLLPVSVITEGNELQAVASLAAGVAHVCAHMMDGTLRCWGRNNNGQLGLGDGGTGTDRSSPEQVGGLAGVEQVVAAGFRTCVRIGGAAKCWGQNLFGQAGDGSTAQKNSPVDVLGLTTAAHLSIAPNHGCALLDDGTAACWGMNNVGQLGDGTTLTQTSPVSVRAPDGTTYWSGLHGIGAGGAHTCVVDGDEAVHCWGMNNYGQLGDESTSDSSTPVRVRW